MILYYCRSATKRKLWKSTFSEGVRHFERKFQVDGDVARNRSMDRWIGEWCSNNFAAGSFHTKKLCSRLFSREVEFSGTNSDIAFLCHPLGDLGVTYTVHLSMARWKARGRLPIGDNWTFSLAITLETLWADIGQNRCTRKGDGLLSAQILRERGVPDQRFLTSEN